MKRAVYFFVLLVEIPSRNTYQASASDVVKLLFSCVSNLDATFKATLTDRGHTKQTAFFTSFRKNHKRIGASGSVVFFSVFPNAYAPTQTSDTEVEPHISRPSAVESIETTRRAPTRSKRRL